MERIQDFILSDPSSQQNEQPQAKKKTDVTFEIIAKTNTDVVIRRKTSKTEKILAIIPSKGQYYISDGGPASDLTSAEMVKFFAALEEPLSVDLDWISQIEKGKWFADKLLGYLSSFGDVVCTGLLTRRNFATWDPGNYYRKNFELVEIYRFNPKLALYLKEKSHEVEERAGCKYFQPYACGAFTDEGCRDNLMYLLGFAELFGMDKTRLFIDRMVERDLNFSCNAHYFFDLIGEFYSEDFSIVRGGSIESVLNIIKSLEKNRNTEHLNADRFIEYCLTYQREGFQKLDGFFSYLTDSWRMQRQLYGKIREKYPEYLHSYHDKLMICRSMMSDMIDERKIAKRYEAIKAYEWSDENYLIRAPKTAGDIVDEATQQSNCLRSYIDKVAEGQTTVFFLRKKKTPDDSLVTVEVRNGSLVQVKGKFNREPSSGLKDILAKWAQAKGLAYSWQGGVL